MNKYYPDGRPRVLEALTPPAGQDLLKRNGHRPLDRAPIADPASRILGEILAIGGPDDLLTWARGLDLPEGVGYYVVLSPTDNIALVFHRDGETIYTVGRLRDRTGFITAIMSAPDHGDPDNDDLVAFAARLTQKRTPKEPQ